jgi:hypothetical protein
LNIAEKLSQPSAPFLECLPGFHDGVQTWHKWRGDLLPKKCDDLEKRLAEGPVINVPTINLKVMQMVGAKSRDVRGKIRAD